MVYIEPTMSHPLMIRFKNNQCYIAMRTYEFPKVLHLNEKVECASMCGITIFTESGAKRCYGTQLSIESVELKDDVLILYEEGKSIPWKINKEGIVIRRARFDKTVKSDVEFLKDEFGYTRKDIPYLNDYEPYMEYKKTIEEKVLNPVLIDLHDEQYTDKGYFDKDGHFKMPLSSLNGKIIVNSLESEVSLNNGIMLGRENACYGFKVVSARKTIAFPTQCRIVGLELHDELIQVYEAGKTIPWKINADLEVETYAQFLEISRRDMDYLNEKFGLTEADVPNINAYVRQYIKKN